ncbi:MAG: hypothetical protein ACE5EH_13220 [Gammaproteobacteria bacterium]
MKKLISMVIVLVGIYAVGPVIAEPYAPLMPLSDEGKQIMKASGKTDAQREKEAPTKDQIDISPYPGANLSMAVNSNGALISVQLVSKDAPDRVIEWYKEKLVGKGWQFVPSLATKQIGEVVVFVETNNSAVNAFESMKYRQIRISEVNKPDDVGFAGMFGDLSGIKTAISIQIKPIM